MNDICSTFFSRDQLAAAKYRENIRTILETQVPALKKKHAHVEAELQTWIAAHPDSTTAKLLSIVDETDTSKNNASNLIEVARLALSVSDEVGAELYRNLTEIKSQIKSFEIWEARYPSLEPVITPLTRLVELVNTAKSFTDFEDRIDENLLSEMRASKDHLETQTMLFLMRLCSDMPAGDSFFPTAELSALAQKLDARRRDAQLEARVAAEVAQAQTQSQTKSQAKSKGKK